jgi:hypothetical protein
MPKRFDRYTMLRGDGPPWLTWLLWGFVLFLVVGGVLRWLMGW